MADDLGPAAPTPPIALAGGAATDTNGHYQITPLPAGTYRIVALDPTGNHRHEFHNNAISYAAATTRTVTPAANTTTNMALTSS